MENEEPKPPRKIYGVSPLYAIVDESLEKARMDDQRNKLEALAAKIRRQTTDDLAAKIRRENERRMIRPYPPTSF